MFFHIPQNEIKSITVRCLRLSLVGSDTLFSGDLSLCKRREQISSLQLLRSGFGRIVFGFVCFWDGITLVPYLNWCFIVKNKCDGNKRC